MDYVPEFLSYLLYFRLAIIAAGIVLIVLGYMLFARGVFPKGVRSGARAHGMEASVGEVRLTIKNAAPGTCFAALGMLLIAVMLTQGSPEVVYRQWLANGAGERLQIRGGNSTSAPSVLQELKQSGAWFNDSAWTLYEAREELEQAQLLAQLAVANAPSDHRFLHTLAEVQFAAGKRAEALQTLTRAMEHADTETTRQSYQQRLKEWREAQ